MGQSSKMDSFQLKADFLPITVLRLLRHETDLLQHQLENIVLKAPQYFNNTPMIVDFSALDANQPLDVKQVCSLLRQYQMQPIAARGINNQDALPVIPETTQKPALAAKSKTTENTRVATKIITKPVRAGTQVYAKDGDLIIMAPVNAGAEVIADGNIHIYAPLRGRALAGANGDTNARIFCKQLEAELISIAGHYLLNEKINAKNYAQNMVQIFLENNKLNIEIV